MIFLKKIMAEISDNTLMFVEDPIEALRALCCHKDDEIITDKSFIKNYLKVRKISDYGETKAETHLGSLRIYGLVESHPDMAKGGNRMTTKGKVLCKILRKTSQPSKNKQFQNALANLLLKNHYKGKLFKDFLRYIERAKTMDEIKKKYKWRTGLTLIAWCKAAGLAKQIGDSVVQIPKKIVETYTLDKVWKEILRTYEEIVSADIRRRRLLLHYGDLRYKAACNLQMKDHNEFDKWFQKILKSVYKKYINLHGAPTGEYNEEENIFYRKRIYPYVSIVIEK